MEALLNIQHELKAPKNQFNGFGKYKYRSCEDILEALKPLLKTYNCTLHLSDEIKEVGSVLFVEATALIEDNESKDVVSVTGQAGIDINKKGMDVSQCFGSSSSYARKYALNGLFLIDDTKDSDATNDHQPKKEVLSIGSSKFIACKTALIEGKGNIEQIKGKYEVSKEVEQALIK